MKRTTPILFCLALLPVLMPVAAFAFDRCPGQAKDSCLSPQEQYDRNLYRSGRPGGSVLPRPLYREQLGPRAWDPPYVPRGQSGGPSGESYRAKVQLSEARPHLSVVTRLDEVAPYLAQCLTPATGDGKQHQVTFRLIFRADGSLIGPPRITFGLPTPQDSAQETFVNRVVSAISRCTPLPLGGGFEKAIAGRPYLIRFIDGAKKDVKT